MKYKDIIKTLAKFNKWRRGAEITPPNPKQIWIAIDEAIMKMQYYKTMFEYYEDLYKTSIWTLKDNKKDLELFMKEYEFQNLQKQHYLTLLDEVEVLLKDKIQHSTIQAVVENWKQRAMIDLTVHYNYNNWNIKGFNSKK